MLRLKLRASWAPAAAIVAVHGVGAACLVALVPGMLGPAAALLVLILGGVTLRDRALLRTAGSVSRLELSADGAAIVELRDGRRLSGQVASRRYVGRAWVYLHFPGTPRRDLLVTRDMLAAADFRSLKLWALWGRVPAALHSAPAA